MPAPIVLVHDDSEFADALIDRFSPGIRWFTDPVQALTALEIARNITFLITRLQFDDRQPVGLSLARLARAARPQVRVVFTGPPEHRQHAMGIGEFIPEPVRPEHVAMIIEWLDEGLA
jgi:hypothetical protein